MGHASATRAGAPLQRSHHVRRPEAERTREALTIVLEYDSGSTSQIVERNGDLGLG